MGRKKARGRTKDERLKLDWDVGKCDAENKMLLLGFYLPKRTTVKPLTLLRHYYLPDINTFMVMCRHWIDHSKPPKFYVKKITYQHSRNAMGDGFWTDVLRTEDEEELINYLLESPYVVDTGEPDGDAANDGL